MKLFKQYGFFNLKGIDKLMRKCAWVLILTNDERGRRKFWFLKSKKDSILANWEYTRVYNSDGNNFELVWEQIMIE